MTALPTMLRTMFLVLLLMAVGALATTAQSTEQGGDIPPLFLPLISSGAAPMPAGQVPARTNQIIVRYVDQVQATTLDQRAQTAILSTAAQTELTFVRLLADNAIVVKLGQWTDVDAVHKMVQPIRALPEVADAEPDLLMQIDRTPNDPDYPNQWHYFDPASGDYGANLPGAWDVTTGSNAVVVAVLDTGILAHAELVGRTLPGYDMVNDAIVANDGDGRDSDPSDPGDWITAAESVSEAFDGCDVSDSSWHGTHVAGTIGAASDNGNGVAGINWTSKILPVRVLGKCFGYTSDIADGIRWAAGLSVSGVPANPNPAQVINLSLGGYSACGTTYQNAITAANNAGAVVVVSAGNSNDDANDYTPASCNGVITVAATDSYGDRAWFSNYGDSIEISAPGVGVLSTLNEGATVPAADSYAYYNGTSMAAPHVAGIVSLMLSVNANLTPSQVTALLQGYVTAFPSGSNCNTGLCGPGIINAAAVVAAAPSPITPTPPTSTPTPTITATPTRTATPLPNCTIYTSSDVPVTILDLGTVYSTINAPANFTIGDVNLRGLYLRHTFDRDLIIDLISPSNRTVNLINRVGGGGQDFWATNLDDSAVTALVDGSAPFTGLYQPQGTLSDFNGDNSQGVWQLQLTDVAGEDVGTLEGWSLELCSGTPSTPTVTPTATPTGSRTPTATPPPTVTVTPSATQTPNPSAISVTLPTAASGAPASAVSIPINLPGAVSGLNIVAYDFRLTFDPAVLNGTGANSAGTLSDGWNVTVNTTTPGVLQVVAFNTTPLAGSGTLLNLLFNVVGTANSATALSWTTFQFNEGEPAAQTSNGLFTVRSWNLGGTVTYRATTRPMSGVTLDLSGASNAGTVTGASGVYSFTLQTSGAHTVTPSKSGGVNGISAFDAAFIAQCVAGLRNLADCPLLAADTSGNNTLSGFDAAQVAQYAAGLAGPTSRVGRWVFSPASRTYGTLTSDLTTESYGAYLVGEVSGNWQAPAPVAAGATTGPTEAAPVQVTTTKGEVVTLALNQTVTDLLAYQITLHYDPTAGHFVEAVPMAANAHWQVVANGATPGIVTLVGYRVAAGDDAHELVTLHFQPVAGQRAIMPMITMVQLNEAPLWMAPVRTYQQHLPLLGK